MRTSPVTIDGIAGPVVIDMNPLTGRCSVTVSGQPAPGRRRRFTLPTTTGGTVEARIRSSLFDPYPIIKIGPRRFRTGPPVPGWLQVISVLPLLLIVGGLVGGVLAGLGLVSNFFIVRTPQPAAVKAGLMGLVLVAAVGVYGFAAAAILGR